jgi:hypothetical protein
MTGIVVENSLDGQGIRSFHVMSGDRQDLETWKTIIPTTVIEAGLIIEQKEYQDRMRIHHFTARWRAREFVTYIMPMNCTIKIEHPDYCKTSCPLHRTNCEWRRTVFLWALVPNKNLRDQIDEATVTFAIQSDMEPDTGWIRNMLKGIEPGIEVGKLMVVEAYWVPEMFIALLDDRFSD